jgi:hypothetical protein
MAQELLAENYIQADETPVGVQTGFAIEGNGAPEIFLAVRQIEIPEQNYAKTVSRPATANPYPEQQQRIHCECENQSLSTPRQRLSRCRAAETRVTLFLPTLPNSQLLIAVE